MSEAGSDLRALGLFGGKKDEDVGIVAAKPGDELAVAQDHFGIGCAGEDAGRRFSESIVHAVGKVGPAQDRTVGIGRIGGGQLHELGLLRGRLGAQLAQQVDGGGKRELRGAETGDKIAAADAAALFEGFEDVVDCAEAAGDVFGCDGFAGEDAVAAEELKGEGVAGFGVDASSG